MFWNMSVSSGGIWVKTKESDYIVLITNWCSSLLDKVIWWTTLRWWEGHAADNNLRTGWFNWKGMLSHKNLWALNSHFLCPSDVVKSQTEWGKNIEIRTYVSHVSLIRGGLRNASGLWTRKLASSVYQTACHHSHGVTRQQLLLGVLKHTWGHFRPFWGVKTGWTFFQPFLWRLKRLFFTVSLIMSVRDCGDKSRYFFKPTREK